jgi:hypothetical protein
MIERFKRAMKYWMLSVSHLGTVLEISQKDLHKVRISFYIISTFSLIYGLSSAMLSSAGRLPFYAPWLASIPAGMYYAFQSALSLPWGIMVWLTIAGLVYLFTCLAGKEAYYEDALLISALSIAIPYLMFWWIPEMFIIPFKGAGSALPWPELFELERKFAFPGVWQALIIAFGMRKVNNTNRAFCIASAILCLTAFVSLAAVFIR